MASQSNVRSTTPPQAPPPTSWQAGEALVSALNGSSGRQKGDLPRSVTFAPQPTQHTYPEHFDGANLGSAQQGTTNGHKAASASQMGAFPATPTTSAHQTPRPAASRDQSKAVAPYGAPKPAATVAVAPSTPQANQHATSAVRTPQLQTPTPQQTPRLQQTTSLQKVGAGPPARATPQSAAVKITTVQRPQARPDAYAQPRPPVQQPQQPVPQPQRQGVNALRGVQLGAEVVALVIGQTAGGLEDATVLSLPADLRKEVLAAIYDRLSPLVLVSKGFKKIAEKLLWTHLFFRRPMTPQALANFCALASSANSPSQHTRFVHLDISASIPSSSGVTHLPKIETIFLPSATSGVGLSWLPSTLPKLVGLKNLSADAGPQASSYVDAVAGLISRAPLLSSISVTDGSFATDPKLACTLANGMAVRGWTLSADAAAGGGGEGGKKGRSVEGFEWRTEARFEAGLLGAHQATVADLRTLKIVQSPGPLLQRRDSSIKSLTDLFRGSSLRHLDLFLNYGHYGMLDNILKICPALTHLGTWTSFVTDDFFRSLCNDRRRLVSLLLRHASHPKTTEPSTSNTDNVALHADSAAFIDYVSKAVVRFEDEGGLKWGGEEGLARMMLLSMEAEWSNAKVDHLEE